MEEVKLDVQIRNEIGKKGLRKVRSEDFVPAIVYGGEKKDPTPVKVDRRTYEKIMRQHHGQTFVFHLNVLEGETKLRDYSAIVRDEQYHFLKDSLLHIDFQRISLKEELEIEVPIEIKGEAIGVSKNGGSLDQPLRELDIICLPTNMPENIEVDVTHLDIGDAIHVSDIKLPPGVRTKHNLDAMVVSVVPPMQEEEEQEIDADAQPEVTGEKPKVAEASGDEKKPSALKG